MRMGNHVHVAVTAVLWMVVSSSAFASGKELALSVGRFDFDRSRGTRAPEIGAELRLQDIELKKWGWGSVSPAFGVVGTDEGATYGYGGLRLQMPVGRFRFALHSAVGVFDEGDGLDLGGPLEFRSGLEAVYVLRSDVVLGANFYHLSNGGIYDENPGTNSLTLSVGFHPGGGS